jgi:hypothetical protein
MGELSELSIYQPQKTQAHSRIPRFVGFLAGFIGTGFAHFAALSQQ